MSINENINEKINFDFLMEFVSETAKNLNNKALELEHRSSYYAPTKDELRFSLESFLYYDYARPKLTLVKELSEHKNLIEEAGFKKNSLKFNNKLVEYYTNNDDENLIIYEDPFSKNFILRYENDFMSEKKDLRIRYENDYLTESVISILKVNDAYSYANVTSSNVNKLAEKIMNQHCLHSDNSLLKEQLASYAFELSERLYETFDDMYHLVYSEDVVNNNILPRITFIDKELNSAEGTIIFAYKESYNSQYQPVIVKVYADEEIDERLNEIFTSNMIYELIK